MPSVSGRSQGCSGLSPAPAGLHRPLLKGLLRGCQDHPSFKLCLEARPVSEPQRPSSWKWWERQPRPRHPGGGASSAHTGHPWVLLPDPGAKQADPECRELEAKTWELFTCLPSGA